MLQRSTHDTPVLVPDIPALVSPGETVDHDRPIAGFEPVPEPEPEAPAKTRRRAAPDTQEG